MKSIIKTIWSVWDRTDRFVAIFSTIGIILLMCIFCTSCNAQTPSNIPDMKYNDASEEILDYDGAILFYADGIIDFIYHTQDNEYVIEYNDPDAFDPEDMLYNKEYDYYYIEIYCDSTIFFDYLSWYNKYTNKDPEFYEASDTFFIEEDYIVTDEGDIPYYKLVKYDTEKNLGSNNK